MATDEIANLIREEIEESELTKDTDNNVLAGHGVRRNRAQATQTLTFRVTEDMNKDLIDLAEAQGITVSTLVRGFISTGIAEHRGSSLPDDMARLSTLVERLRVTVGQ